MHLNAECMSTLFHHAMMLYLWVVFNHWLLYNMLLFVYPNRLLMLDRIMQNLVLTA